jgi:CheY-like chemotaxis protein
MTIQSFSGEALLVLDAELNVRAANKSFYELFHLAPEECVGHKVYDVGGRAWDHKLRIMLETVLKGGSRSDHFELVHDEGAPGRGVLWLTAKILPSAKPADRTILLSFEDLTARRSTEDALTIASQELKTFAELAGKSAHELNNLLTIVRMNAELLEPDLAKAGFSIQEVQDIVAAAVRAETLTKQLLVSSRRALPQSTGLDRASAKDAAEMAQGDAVDKAPSASDLKARPPAEIAGGETILLVEDEKALRKLQKRILTKAGYRILEASDGAKALRVAADEVGEIDLVLTDIEMPTLGGRGMVDELNELSPGMRVLFMSGYTDNEILRRGIGTAERQFLQKPFTAEALIAAVQAALGNPVIAAT